MPKVPTSNRTNSTITDQAPASRVNPAAAATGGRILADLGGGVSQISEQLERAQSFAEQTKAENALSTRLRDIEYRAAQDTDTTPEKRLRYREEITRAVEDSSQLVTLPYDRDIFSLRARDSGNIAGIKIDGQFASRMVDQGKADLNTYLDGVKQKYVSTRNMAEKEQAILEHDAKIDAAVAAGFVTREEASKKKTSRKADWDQAHAQNDAYSDPHGFLSREAAGFYEGVDPKTMESLRTSAERLIEKRKEIVDDQTQIQQDQAAASFTSKLVNGASDASIMAELETARNAGTIRDSFYRTMQLALTNKNAGFNGEDSRVVENLYEKWIALQDLEGVKKATAVQDFRENVLLQKAQLSEGRYKDFLTWTDPNFIAQQVPKKNWLRAGLEFVIGHAREVSKATGAPFQLVGMTHEFLMRAQAQNVAPKDVPELARQIVREDAYRRNPELVGREDVTNKAATAEDGFAHVYAGRSAAKPDLAAKKGAVSAPKEGQTATHPTTKQKLVYRSGKWTAA